MASGDEVVQVTTTTDSQAAAGALAARLVEGRLAACVQVVGPIQSTYRWEGRIETATEWLCLAKTTATRVDALVDDVRRHHSYDVPEVLATPVVGGSGDYLRWVAAETDPGRG